MADPETLAFELDVVEDYQLYVSRLAKVGGVQPKRNGVGKPKPVRREAVGNEERLLIGTQKDLVDVVRLLWKAARKSRLQSSFTAFPGQSPTELLEWRDEVERDPVRIQLDLNAMLHQPFMAAKGRSLLEHDRNVLLAHFYCALPTRNAELREAVWEALQVWEIKPGAELPTQRWPLEALLCGEVQLDATHILFLTLGGAVPTKSDTFRSVPLVGALADRAIAYALVWVEDQLKNLKYLRYRSRDKLADKFRAMSFDQRSLKLLVAGKQLTVHELEQDFALFKGAHALQGRGMLKWDGTLYALDEKQTQAFRDLLWAEAAETRYTDALAAFADKTPIRDVFAGVFLGSRIGGVLCDSRIQTIWREMGWTAKGWKAQHLRAHAAQLFENAALMALRPLGGIIGHKQATTTALNYTGRSPFRDVVVAELIAEELKK